MPLLRCRIIEKSKRKAKFVRYFSDSRHERPLSRSVSINSSFTLSSENVKKEQKQPNKVQLEDNVESDVETRTLMKKLSNSLVGENVHASYSSKKEKDKWRKRPLFNRSGVHAVFKTGTDAANLLVQEARRRDPYQGDFLDAVEDIVYDLAPAIEEDPRRAWIFKKLMEPEYMSTFRVPWKDDLNISRINRGFLVLFSGGNNKYNGDAKFSSSLSHGMSRMLGWEHNLRSAIATRDIEADEGFCFGGMMCGSDFEPDDKSENEILAFCSGFVQTMTPLTSKITSTCLIETGPYVGRREMKFLKQAYNANFGSQANKMFGSSVKYPEFKGFGCVYFAQRALQLHLQDNLNGKSCIVSGSGLLSRNIATKLLDVGAKPVTLSDDSGILFNPNGLSIEVIKAVEQFRAQNLPLKDFARSSAFPGVKFINDMNIFRQNEIEADVVFSAKGMGEMNVDDATFLEDQSVQAVFECTHKGVTTNARMLLSDREVLFAPAKAVAAGQSVATKHTDILLSKDNKEFPDQATLEIAVKTRMYEIVDEISAIAEMYNLKGDLKAGANLLSFLRLAKRENSQKLNEP